MGSQPGGEMQLTCLSVHQNGTDFLPWADKSRGKSTARGFCCHCCSPLRSLGSALARRALQEMQRRLSWGMWEKTGDQASFPCRSWKPSRYQTTGNKSLLCNFQIGRKYICSTLKIHHNLKPKVKTADNNPTKETFISPSYYFSSFSFSQSVTIPVI